MKTSSRYGISAGLTYIIQMDSSTQLSKLGVPGFILLLLFYFFTESCVYANSVDPDQTVRSATSDLGYTLC